MSRYGHILMCLGLCWCLAPAALAAEEGNDRDPAVPTWFKASFLDLADDVKEAATHNKRLMLYFHQAGCPYCALLINTNLSQKPLVDYLNTHIEAVAIDLWGDREITDLSGRITTEKDFAQGLKVWFTPTLLFLNEQGEVILRINGYYPPHQFNAALHYVAERQERLTSFRDYYAQLSPAPSAGQLHPNPQFIRPPYDLPDLSDKPLMVLFEQRDCPACDTLHDEIMTHTATRAQLNQFHVVQLDMWSETPVTTPSGRRMRARQWAQELGIVYAPSAILFDKGQEIIRIEAFLKGFHVQSVLEYVASGAYHKQPNLQRFLQTRAERLREQGQAVDVWQ